jgi:hypothetical protein
MRAFRYVGGGRYATLAILLATLPLACTQVVQRPPTAGVVAQLALDRFMQAVNQRDLITMEQTFGTEDGPISDTGGTFKCFFKKIGSWFGGSSCTKQADVQVRMAAIADILKHDDYKVVRAQPVAGRLSDATQIFVDLTLPDHTVENVPFTLVRSKDGQWLVEYVDLNKVMGGG